MVVVQAQKESLISLSTMYMIQFKHTLYHAVVIRGQDEGQNHDHFLQGVFKCTFDCTDYSLIAM